LEQVVLLRDTRQSRARLKRLNQSQMTFSSTWFTILSLSSKIPRKLLQFSRLDLKNRWIMKSWPMISSTTLTNSKVSWPSLKWDYRLSRNPLKIWSAAGKRKASFKNSNFGSKWWFSRNTESSSSLTSTKCCRTRRWPTQNTSTIWINSITNLNRFKMRKTILKGKLSSSISKRKLN
jgi:hypothetical protein